MLKSLMIKGFIKGMEKGNKMKRIFKNESGQGFSEYGMILVLVLVLAIPLIVSFRDEINDIIGEITTAIETR